MARPKSISKSKQQITQDIFSSYTQVLLNHFSILLKSQQLVLETLKNPDALSTTARLKFLTAANVQTNYSIQTVSKFIMSLDSLSKTKSLPAKSQSALEQSFKEALQIDKEFKDVVASSSVSTTNSKD